MKANICKVAEEGNNCCLGDSQAANLSIYV